MVGYRIHLYYPGPLQVVIQYLDNIISIVRIAERNCCTKFGVVTTLGRGSLKAGGGEWAVLGELELDCDDEVVVGDAFRPCSQSDLTFLAWFKFLSSSSSASLAAELCFHFS